MKVTTESQIDNVQPGLIKPNSITAVEANNVQPHLHKTACYMPPFSCRSDAVSELYNMDCVEGMKHYPDKYFDLAIVDPPYGINATEMQMGSHPTRSRNDGYGSGPGISTAVKLKGRLNNGSGKLKNRLLNKSNIGWDNEKPTKEYFEQLFRISKNQIIWGGNYFDLSTSRCVLCWDKCQPWENFSQWEMAWTSFDKPAALFKYSNTGGANVEKKIHPTQKPIKLYKWILSRFAKPGQRI